MPSLSTLPTELLDRIFSHLPPSTTLSVQLTCRRFHTILSDVSYISFSSPLYKPQICYPTVLHPIFRRITRSLLITPSSTPLSSTAIREQEATYPPCKWVYLTLEGAGLLKTCSANNLLGDDGKGVSVMQCIEAVLGVIKRVEEGEETKMTRQRGYDGVMDVKEITKRGEEDGGAKEMFWKVGIYGCREMGSEEMWDHLE